MLKLHIIKMQWKCLHAVTYLLSSPLHERTACSCTHREKQHLPITLGTESKDLLPRRNLCFPAAPWACQLLKEACGCLEICPTLSWSMEGAGSQGVVLPAPAHGFRKTSVPSESLCTHFNWNMKAQIPFSPK